MIALLSIVILLQAPPPPDPGTPVAPALPKALVDAPLPWRALVVDQCKAKLTYAGLTGADYRFSKIADVATRPAPWGSDAPPLYCHVPQGTVLWVGPTGIHYNGFTHMSCALTLALARFEEVAQDEARRVWQRPDSEMPIRQIAHLGTFNCRRQRLRAKVSQHSLGNALDLQAFEIKGVGVVSVLRDWRPRSAKPTPWQLQAADFLQSLSRRLREEEVFTNVLDPDWDAWHRNHIHVDLAPTSHGEPSPALARAQAMPPEAAGDARPDALAHGLAPLDEATRPDDVCPF